MLPRFLTNDLATNGYERSEAKPSVVNIRLSPELQSNSGSQK